ncbi:MAG TPA: Hsp20/alpha crystallin family protein [Opitutaceae bacterium]|nr:Hsp20/alpha crystallin family protein [Opitutaceae bacterium]
MNTQLTRWNPFKDLDDLQNRLAAVWLPAFAPGAKENLTVAEWTPRVDIIEDEHEFLIRAELPDMKKENVKVTVEDGVLTLAGERKLEKEEKNKKYHRIEREYGAFARSFTLPAGTSGERVAADFKDGLLQVHLPKDARGPAAKSVEIKVA